jgi:hypothetical protein
MNLIPWIVGGVVKQLLRECPQCRHKQFVSSEHRHEPVTCERCGAGIPPPLMEDSRGRGSRRGG